MATKGTRNLTLPARIFMILSCACMTAFMFTITGSYVWNEMLVGATLIFFIYAFFGNRRKMNYESIPVGIILIWLTVVSIEAFSGQMSGYLSSGSYGGDAITRVAIGPYSGLVIMLLLGFGLIPLFSIFIGSLFSRKEYKIWKYAVIIAVFYVVSIAFEFSASHYILLKIMPQAVENFKLGLADSGIDLSPMKFYIRSLGGGSLGAGTVPYGEFYFASILAISRAFAALISSLVVLIAFKDKITGFVSFKINLVSALAIALASVPLMADSDRGLLANRQIPTFFTADKVSIWRFFTGFLLGFGIMLILVCLPKKVLDGEGKYKEKSFLAKDFIRFLYGSVAVLFFPTYLLIAKPLGFGIYNMLKEANKFGTNDFAVDLKITASFSLIALIICLLICKKNYINKGLQVPVAMRCEDFCIRALPVYLFAVALIYYFTGSERITALPFAEMKSFASFKVLFFNGALSVAILTISAFVLFCVFFFTAKKCVKVEKRK